MVSGWIREQCQLIDADEPPIYIKQFISKTFYKGSWNYTHKYAAACSILEYEDGILTKDWVIFVCYLLYSIDALRECLIFYANSFPKQSLCNVLGLLFDEMTEVTFSSIGIKKIVNWFERLTTLYDLNWQTERDIFLMLDDIVFPRIYEELQQFAGASPSRYIQFNSNFIWLQSGFLCAWHDGKVETGTSTTEERECFINLEAEYGSLDNAMVNFLHKGRPGIGNFDVYQTFNSLSPWLFIRIVRQGVNEGEGQPLIQQKDMRLFDFPPYWNANKYVFKREIQGKGCDYHVHDDDDIFQYKLYGIVMHHGNMAYGRLTYLRGGERGDWIEYDCNTQCIRDEHYYKTSFGGSWSKNTTAYIILYHRHTDYDKIPLISDKIPLGNSFNAKAHLPSANETQFVQEDEDDESDIYNVGRKWDNLSDLSSVPTDVYESGDPPKKTSETQKLLGMRWNILITNELLIYPKGIINPGLRCWLNTVINLLYTLNGLRESLIKYHDVLPQNSLCRTLSDAFIMLDSVTNHAIDSTLIMQWLRTNKPNTNWFTQQHDAIIFLHTIVLPTIHEELDDLVDIYPFTLNPNFIKFKLRTISKNNQSLISSNTINETYSIKVHVDQHDSLPAAIIFNVFQPINVTNNGIKQYETIYNAPKWLFIWIKRFNNTQKLYNKFKFPLTLDLAPYIYNENGQTNDPYPVDSNDAQKQYRLVGIVSHRGVDTHGHYVYLYRDPKNKWTEINDDKVAVKNKTYYKTFFGDGDSKKSYQNTAVLLLYHLKGADNQHFVLGDRDYYQKSQLAQQQLSEKTSGIFCIYYSRIIHI